MYENYEYPLTISYIPPLITKFTNLWATSIPFWSMWAQTCKQYGQIMQTRDTRTVHILSGKHAEIGIAVTNHGDTHKFKLCEEMNKISPVWSIQQTNKYCVIHAVFVFILRDFIMFVNGEGIRNSFNC